MTFSLCIAYIIVILRLFYWQVVRHEDITKIASSQSQETLVFEAIRGEVISKDNYPLATNTFTYLLYANPKTIPDKKEYAKVLSEILNRDEEQLKEILSKDLYWIKIADNLDSPIKQEIENRHLKGLGFQQTALRFYPEASMAAQLLGFVGKDREGRDKGYFGLEGYYDDQLSGRPGRLFLIRDALGNPVYTDIREEKKIDGRSLVTTLDRTVQFMLEKRLKDGIARYEADGGSAAVIEPKTGKILAMASFPRFDPQKYFRFESSTYKNPILSNVYEPGSTFKVLVMSAAVDSGVVKADTKCDICDGAVQIGEYRIKTWNDKYYPESSMTEVIQHSDNIGMVFVSKKLGLKNFLTYMKNFGIGEITGIDLQGEISSDLKSEGKWYPIDLATASFGQGISVTPLQLLMGVSAIANNGTLMKPFVVSQIITEDKKKIDIKPEVKRRVVKEETAQIVAGMMVNAVEKGEAKWTKIPNYKIAGKTGTAQIPVAGHYDPHKTIASFVGFFPATDPKVAMLVLLDTPKTSPYGSETAAPIFFNIAQDLIRYYNIPPSY